MDNLIIFCKCILLYLVALIPLLRQLQGFDAYHIGNMAGYRVAGLSLSRIFFSDLGVPIPLLSLSVQYDYFKNDIRRFKLFHISFISMITPLVYLFALSLTGSDPIALAAATLYGISFNFPINLNWFVEPEHYELFFTLLGGTLAMIGGQTGSVLLVCTGAVFLGLSQLCKFPALLSAWTMGYLIYNRLPETLPASLIIGTYLAPAIVYVVTKKLAFPATVNPVATGIKGNLLSRIFGYYYYRYKIDPKAYIQSMFTDRAKDYVVQHLPIMFLALLFFIQGNCRLTMFYGLTILFLSLIFLLRMTIWYTQSVIIIICIAAGYGLEVLVTSRSTIPILLLCATIPVSYIAITSYPYFKLLFHSESGSELPLQSIANHMTQIFLPGETWLFNINNGYSYVYLLAGRGMSNFFCHVLMGAYGPRKINLDIMPPNLYQEGADIVYAFSKSPPTYIVQSLTEGSIVNVAYIEQICSLTYEICDVLESFVIFKLVLKSKPDDLKLSEFNAKVLFDADQAKYSQNLSLLLYMKYKNQLTN